MKTANWHRKTEDRHKSQTCASLREFPLPDLFQCSTTCHTLPSRERRTSHSPRKETRLALPLSELPQHCVAVRDDASNRNSVGHLLRQPTVSRGFRHRRPVRRRSRLARYFAGTGCGVACGVALGVEKFTFGTWRDSSEAAK